MKPDLQHVPSGKLVMHSASFTINTYFACLMNFIVSDVSIKTYAGPEQRFCPAGVYEYTEPAEGTGEQTLVINAQVCLAVAY